MFSKSKMLNLSAEASMSEEDRKAMHQMRELEQQIDLCNAQISDLQQKLIDADQGRRSKFWKQTCHLYFGQISVQNCFCCLSLCYLFEVCRIEDCCIVFVFFKSDEKCKSRWSNIHTMVEAKCAMKYLLTMVRTVVSRWSSSVSTVVYFYANLNSTKMIYHIVIILPSHWCQWYV